MGHFKIRACFEFRASDFEFLSLNTILKNYQEIHKRIKSPLLIAQRGLRVTIILFPIFTLSRNPSSDSHPSP